ncbi:MAG: hypothetical protein RLZZ46_1106 [Bacteroidota bacterium]|jgi:2-polyprenyl-3-methyl-5-hydroxy-6-metoxy-1,4-benzoquinol methylase
MQRLLECPLCAFAQFNGMFSATDYTVSRDSFHVVSCGNCGFYFTNPRPLTSDLGKYYAAESYISHSDTQKGIKNKLYHFARGIALRGKISRIKALFGAMQGRALDVGCGTGYFLLGMKEQGWAVEGIEPDPGAAKQASARSGCPVYEEAQLNRYPEASFDLITMWHVLEHVPDPLARIRQLRRILKSGGRLIIAVPNHSSLDAQHYGSCWAAWDVPRHLNHFIPKDMKRLLNAEGFDFTGMKGMPLDSFYISLLSEQYRGRGAIAFPAAFFHGLRSNLHARLSDNSSWSSIEYYFQKP